MSWFLYLSALLLCGALPVEAQKAPPLQPRPLSGSVTPSAESDPTNPPARMVRDARTHVSFRLPAGWNLSRNDGELSTFHLDARTAPRRAQVALAADIGFNPYPRSTFSGALLYLSLTPQSTTAECAAQAVEPAGTALIGDVLFHRGKDAHGTMCTEARDTIYTAMRQGSCVRFDLAINSFCGGEASGAIDLTEMQLANIQQRLEAILQTVRFSGR